VLLSMEWARTNAHRANWAARFRLEKQIAVRNRQGLNGAVERTIPWL
jgi:hypothetical protein